MLQVPDADRPMRAVLLILVALGLFVATWVWLGALLAN